MHYIDDISYRPWSIIDFRKYQSYLELRKQRDKFLKSLKPGWYVDWLIQKKALEAGGVGDTIYILPARGGSKFPYERIEKYIEEGRDVQVVTSRKQEPKVTRKDVDWFLELLLDRDRDLYCPDPYKDALALYLYASYTRKEPTKSIRITSANPYQRWWPGYGWMPDLLNCRYEWEPYNEFR